MDTGLNTVTFKVKLATQEMKGTMRVPAKVIGVSAVESINGKTGEVELTAADVGALSEDTPIPVVEYMSNSDILAIWNQFYKGE